MLTRILTRAVAATTAAVVAATLASSPFDGALVHGTPGVNPPKNTAKQFRWGNAVWKDEFVGGMRAGWRKVGGGQVRTQHGMLTLHGNGQTLKATFPGFDRARGRWEASMRAKQYERTGKPYVASFSLIPASGACAGKSITIGTFTLGGGKMKFRVRNGGKIYSAQIAHTVTGKQFHTVAIEITDGRISWFMDGKVLRSEKRDAAIANRAYNVQFKMQGHGSDTREGRMQMDWVRFYTLARKNAKSTAASQLSVADGVGGC